MKKVLIAIAGLLFASGDVVFAQHRISNTTNLSVSGGLSSHGWNLALGSEFVLGDPQHSIVASLRYFDMKIPTTHPEIKVPVRDYALSVSYAYSLCNYIFAPVNLSFNAGVSAGFEQFPKTIGDIQVKQNNGFIYGLHIGTAFDVYLTKGLSAFIEPKLFYWIASPINQFNFSANIGLRIAL